MKKYVDEIEKLIARSNRYAEYMQERSAKLLRMIKTGRFSEVGHIDSLNSLYI